MQSHFAGLARFAVLLLPACQSGPSADGSTDATSGRPPNVLLVFTDDQGYGDLGCYGHPTIRTPRLDRLAAGGVKLTQFYVGSPVCSPSRAALLTGCYPIRIGMHQHVVFPPDDWGLNPDEVTLAEVLRGAGYATGCFGKWHLGHRRGLLPTDQGFDRFAGVPYSNDMAQFHRRPDAKYRFRLPWMEDDRVTEWEPDQHLLTRRQTDAALAFIDETCEADADRPFFVYVPYSMPHIPIYASPEHEGRSPRGLYGDVIEEIDASVGRLLDRLEHHGVRDDTLVLFASDNGPWLPYKLRGGSAGPLRGGKGTNFEGGQRVPLIASWPGRIPAGLVSTDLVTAMDVLPTIAARAGATLGPHELDGSDRWSSFTGSAPAEERAFFYYTSKGAPFAVRRGPWKLFLESGELYDVERDVGEQFDRAQGEGEVVASLREEAERWHERLTRDARPRGTSPRLAFDPARPEPPDQPAPVDQAK